MTILNQWIPDYVRPRVVAPGWATANGLQTIGLVGGKGGRMAGVAEQSIVIKGTRYGRVEDARIEICHPLCYAFVERLGQAK